MRRLWITMTLLAGAAVTAFGQVEIGPQIGLDLAHGDLYIGGNAVFDLPWELGDQTVKGNPEVYFYWLDDAPGYSQSRTAVSISGLYPLGLDFANAYLGGGLLMSFYSAHISAGYNGNPVERNPSDTDVGLNTKLGVDFAKPDSKFAPWVEVGLQIIDGGGFWLQGGARLIL